jgi:hypothetical protein
MFDRLRGLPSPFGSRMFWSFSAKRFHCQIHAEQAAEGKGWTLSMVGFWVIDLIDLRRDRKIRWPPLSQLQLETGILYVRTFNVRTD